MEDTLKEPECFLIREDLIRRLPQLVFAASQACRWRYRELPGNMAALPKALGARCPICGFSLNGDELLALAGISHANESSTMVKRLRAGQCAREGCTASHYHLSLYDIPEISWSAIFAESGPKEAPRSKIEPPAKHAAARWSIPPKYVHAVGFAAVFFLAWMWWQWRSGGTIPLLRQPEHFRVTPSNVEHHPYEHL